MRVRGRGELGLCLGLVAAGMITLACAEAEDQSSASVGGNVTGTSTSAGGDDAGARGGSAPNTPSTATAGGSESSTGLTTSTCTGEDAKFSFFLASQAALVRESGSADGFGGDLGGLVGADAICQRIAETSAPCHKGKIGWRAFLSTSTVNAKDRIGKGPWYDRRGRLLAQDLANLLKDRPAGGDSAIVNDLPNENGTPNHKPDGTQVDNHQIITGTGTDGNVYKQSTTGTGTGKFTGSQNACLETWSVDSATCRGWTTKKPEGCPRVGHSWPAMSGTNWMSVWNESGCAPGGTGAESGGTDSSRKIGSAGGYGGFYCFAVTGS
ncbi:MAG: hypothetical protein ACM3ZE_00195 [Myxococcales bacterium]